MAATDEPTGQASGIVRGFANQNVQTATDEAIAVSAQRTRTRWFLVPKAADTAVELKEMIGPNGEISLRRGNQSINWSEVITAKSPAKTRNAMRQRLSILRSAEVRARERNCKRRLATCRSASHNGRYAKLDPTVVAGQDALARRLLVAEGLRHSKPP
jgi:hypothetical protein